MFLVQILLEVYRTLLKLSPRFETHSFKIASPWGECSAFLAADAILTISIFRSTWFPLLLFGQRQCGSKACPRILQMVSDVGIEP